MHPICNPINLCPASFVNIPNTDDKRAYAEYRLFAAIQRARRDMLDKPVADLRRMRYTDYSGKVDAWPITSIIGPVGGRSAAGVRRPHNMRKDLATTSTHGVISIQLAATLPMNNPVENDRMVPISQLFATKCQVNGMAADDQSMFG